MAYPTGQQIQQMALHRARERSTDILRWTILSNIYRGNLRSLFPREFREGEVLKLANFIKRSWDSFSRHVGKVPDVRVAPLSLKPRAQERADRQEKICFAYNHVWAMKRKMRALAWYFVGFGAVGIGLVPDPRSRFPMLLVEDPRNCFPSASSDSTNVSDLWPFSTEPTMDLGGFLDDMIVRKTLPGSAVNRLFGYDYDPIQPLNVLQYYDSEHWCTVLEDGGRILAQGEHGAGGCPWYMPTTFAADAPAGVSMFEQQIGVEIAFMRILDQKLALNDSVVWPWKVVKGAFEEDPATRTIYLGSQDASFAFASPPATFQVDRDLILMQNLLRLMNFETEASQGEVTGGPITGRGIVELSKPVIETIQFFFDDLSFYLARLYAHAMVIDRNVFGGETKVLAGRGRGETFMEEYTPAKDIGDKVGMVSIEFGPGLGGFEGHLQMLQDLGAESISTITVMEKNPHIRSVSEEKRRIWLEKLERLLFDSALTGEAAVPVPWIAQLMDAISSGRDPKEWIVNNPPGQAQMVPENVAPLPPEIAAAGGQPALPAPGPPGEVAPPSLAQLLAG